MDHPFDSKILIPTLPQGTEDVCQVAIAALQKARWSIPVSYLNVAILALESKFTPRTADEFFLPSGEADTSRRVIKHLLSAYITRFALYQSMDDFDSCVSIWSVILKKASCPGVCRQMFPASVIILISFSGPPNLPWPSRNSTGSNSRSSRKLNLPMPQIHRFRTASGGMFTH